MEYNRITLTMVLPYSIPPIEYVSDALPWHPTLQWEQRDPSAIRRIIVHHMASEAPLVNQASYHINAHGWPGLSYHLAVSEGRLVQINDILSLTYHAASNNEDTVAIAVHGDLSKRELRQDEREILYAGILTLRSLFPGAEILGHNEVNKTACPCISMNQVRQDIQTLEMRMERSKSKAARKERAYAVVNQATYMYSLIGKNDGNEEWSLNWFEDFHQYLKSKDML